MNRSRAWNFNCQRRGIASTKYTEAKERKTYKHGCQDENYSIWELVIRHVSANLTVLSLSTIVALSATESLCISRVARYIAERPDPMSNFSE
jgi:hypothetical protein